jgi:GGDEF domain-containing protein
MQRAPASASASNTSRKAASAGGHDLARLARSAWQVLATGLRAPRKAPMPGPSSLVVFDVSELTELRQIFGDRAADHTVAAIQRILRGIDPVLGRVSRTTATSFAVLLPGYDEDAAAMAVHGALGESLAIESDWHGEELVVVPDFLVRAAVHSREGVDRLHRQMLVEIGLQQRLVRRHREYLRRERESHFHTTRPAPPSADGTA